MKKIQELYDTYKVYLTRHHIERFSLAVIVLSALWVFLSSIPLRGVLTLDNGAIRYDGSVVRGKMNGEGTVTFQNGDTYKGNFVNGTFSGKGTFTSKAGWKYEGEFVNGQPEGKGTLTTEQNVVYKEHLNRGFIKMRIKWFSLVRITGLLLVLLYHFFQKFFPGGFIGVDIFFTFSGFLITALLIDEFARHQKIDLKGFLKRRFYRIVPPLVFMVLLVMPFTFLVRRDFIAGIGTQIAAVFGFVTNFYEMLSGGSYESQFIPHLFIHTWSLALEVHYYVLWALLAWFLAKKAKTVGQYRGLIFLSSVGLFLVSFMTFFIGALLTKNLSNVYFSSMAHIFPFFVGSALATVTGITTVSPNFTKLAKSWTSKKALSVLGGAFAVLLLLTFILPFDSIWTYLFGFLVATLLQQA